jgi:hypothetical protein
MGKQFIDPKSSEILSIFQVFPCTTQIALFWPKLLPALVFPCTTQIALFWPKLLPALFLKKP